MDAFAREGNASFLGRSLYFLIDDTREWTVNQMLFAELVADSPERLRQLVEKFGRVSERRKLKMRARVK